MVRSVDLFWLLRGKLRNFQVVLRQNPMTRRAALQDRERRKAAVCGDDRRKGKPIAIKFFGAWKRSHVKVELAHCFG